jgi:hypothetical protein
MADVGRARMMRTRMLRPSHLQPDVEQLEQLIHRLQRERQELRRANPDTVPLERNRLELARAQRELSLALIEQHLDSPSAA